MGSYWVWAKDVRLLGVLRGCHQSVGAIAEGQKTCFSYKAVLAQGQMVYGLTVMISTLEINIPPHMSQEVLQWEVS